MSVPHTLDGTAAAVLYGAKSTEDKRGSLPTQLADGRALAEREGWQVVAEYSDESASAYKGNRGQGLADAKACAEQLVRDGHEVILVVQHSDRLARGDGGHALHLIEYVFWARRVGVRLCSVQDDHTFDDELHAFVMGQRNHEDSRRKSLAVAAGKQRQFERGETIGPPADGYRCVVDPDGTHRRELDPERTPIVERIFDMVEAGGGCGEIGRALTAEGIRAGRGGLFNSRTVRKIVTNPYYAGWVIHHGQRGEGLHPRLIDRERWERINASLTRMDPAAVQKRAGGRRPQTPYLLRGVAFCGRCGAALYTRDYAAGRHYICRHVRQANGVCDAPAIRADVLEQKVLGHLDDFYSGFDEWARGRMTARADEATVIGASVDALRARLPELERARDKHLRAYRRYVDADDNARADLALDEVQRIDAEHAAQQTAIADAESRLAEWTAAPSTDGLLDLYADVRAVVSGRLAHARSHDDLRTALGSLMEGIWVDLPEGKLTPDKRVGVLALEVVLRDEHRRLDDDRDSVQDLKLWWAEPDTSPWCRNSRWPSRSPRRNGRRP